jgi:PKD repeat protein
MTKMVCIFIPIFLLAPYVNAFEYQPHRGELAPADPLAFVPERILLYYGNGGSYPGLSGERATFYDLQARYDSQGCPTDYTDVWPNDLLDYRVIFFIMPGVLNDDGSYFFTLQQIHDIKDFLRNGRRLVVQGEHSGVFGIDTVNNLLASLGVGITQNADNVLHLINPAATDITLDQITDGVSALDMDGAGVSSLTLSGTAKSLIRDSGGNDVVAVGQIFASPPRPGADVLMYGDTQVLDDYQLRDRDGGGVFDNLVFADNIAGCAEGNLPPIAVVNPSNQTINEGDTAYLSGYGSYDPDPKVDMLFVVDTSPSMPDEWQVLSNSLPQIEANLLAQGYDLEFVVYGLDHGTETPAKWPVMDYWLDYGARSDGMGGILQDCVRNKQISNPHNHNVQTPNPTTSLLDPNKRCDDYSTRMSEGWAQGAAYMAINFPWRDASTRIIVPIGDSAPMHQYIDGSPAKTWWGHPNLIPDDWTIINETSQILNDNGVLAFPMYDDDIDPDDGGPGVGPQQQLFILMADHTGGMAFPLADSQGFIDNVNALIESIIVKYSWDFDASVDLNSDGDYTNDNEANGMDVSHTYYDDCFCTVTLTVTDAGGTAAQAQATVTVLNVAPTVEWTSRSDDGTILLPPYPEGKEILFESDVYDPGIYDTFTYDWDLGDGTILLDGPPSVVHAYGDNGVYNVVLTVTDDDGDSGTDDTPPLEAYNVDPEITTFWVPLCIFFEGGTPCELGGEFRDPGWLDTHEAQFDWGYGSVEDVAVTEENDPPDATGSFMGSRTYGDDGDFEVTVSVFDDEGGSDTKETVVHVANVAPVVFVSGDAVIDEGGTVHLTADIEDPGSDDVFVTWDWGDGTIEKRTYYNDGLGPDPPLSPDGRWPFNIRDTASHMYGDNGNFTVTVTAEDDDAGKTTVYKTVVVNNVDPTIESTRIYANATVVFRIAGEKWHDVKFHLYEDGTEIAYAEIVRYPGSPDDQAVTLADITLSFSSHFSFVAYYTPDDDPVNGQPWGATPAWVILRFEDGTEARIHHTFNVRHPDTWVWEEDDLSQYLVGHSVTFEATASDIGSDDLTFLWDWGDSTTTSTTYFNNGVSPDPFPSPEYNPITVTDIQAHAFMTPGPHTITLTVTDDDGDSVSITLVF